jgi:Holliday junction DNA helicase RuvA
MIAYINGVLESKASTYIVVDVMGIGYKIYMSGTSIDKIGECGEKVKIHTHYYVREDNISLYGFLTNDELKMFELLLQVSGIGAKSAINMLSEISPSSFALAVITNDVSKLVKIQGIGTKTAQRIILELKDKLKTEQAQAKEEEVIKCIIDDNTSEEAICALQILGYTKREIEKALERIDKKDLTVEEIIRKALAILGK